MKNRYHLPFLMLAVLYAGPSISQKGLQYFEIGQNIWHIEPFPDDESKKIALAGYHGNIGLFDAGRQETKWIYQSGSFVMDLKVADLEGDGQMEIVFVNVGGELIVINAKGQKLFEFRSKLPLYSVDTGNLSGDKRLEIAFGGIDRHVYILDATGNLIGKSQKMERLVHRLACGNLAPDDLDEVLVIENRVTGNILKWSAGEVVSILRKDLGVPQQYVNWENPIGKFYPFSLEISDLDEDGTPEIIAGDTFFNKQSVALFNTQLDAVWISDRVPQFEWIEGAQTEFYSTAFVRSADVFDHHPGKEVIAIAGGLVRVWNRKGELLGSLNNPVGFTDFFVDRGNVFLASSPNGDDHIYRLKFDDQWEEHLSGISYRGQIREIRENTEKLARQVEAYKSGPQGDQQYDVIIGFSSLDTTAEWLASYHRELAWFREKFPYDNLRIIKNLKVIEDQPPLKPNGEPWNLRRYRLDGINGVMTVEEILQKARWIEANKIPTLFYIGHSCTPFVTLETVEKILQAAPNYCIGFRTAEDEQIEMLPEYFEHYFGPLTELCLKYGYKKCITKNKGIWWMSTPSIPAVFESVFAGEARKIMIAATEDSNSRTPEMNLMGRGGLWQAGLIAGNDVSIHGDLFSFNRFQQWEYPKTGHPYLRLLVAHTSMGMTYSNSRIRDLYQTPDSIFFTPAGKESTEIFYHLLGKGLVFSPKRKDILGYSPLGMIVHQPPEEWLTDAHNGHSPEKWQDLEIMHQAVFPHNGNLWGMTNTPDHAFQKVIFHKDRQFGYQIPATPYGLVAFVPQQADTTDVANINRWLHTDGLYIWKNGGPKLQGMAAAKMLEAEFELAAQELPFRVKGDAFLQTIRMGIDHYRLLVVDPGWVDPQDRNVDISIQLSGHFQAEDILAGEKVAIEEQSISLRVPAGLFRIIDLEKVE